MSAVTLASGTILSGTGSVGAVTSTDGTIAPGDGPGAIGTLRVASLPTSTSTDVDVEIASASSYDQIVSSGAIDLSVIR